MVSGSFPLGVSVQGSGGGRGCVQQLKPVARDLAWHQHQKWLKGKICCGQVLRGPRAGRLGPSVKARYRRCVGGKGSPSRPLLKYFHLTPFTHVHPLTSVRSSPMSAILDLRVAP